MARFPGRPGRVHITGGPGSGKSTRASRLGRQLGVPVHDLDWVGWGGTGGLRPLAVLLPEVYIIAAEPEWITEGAMLGWTDPLFRAADLVIWLDVPWRVALWRMVLRHIRAELRGNNRHRGVGRLLRFLWYTRHYYTGSAPPGLIPMDGDGQETRRETVHRLAAYPDKSIRLRRPAVVRALLTRIGQTPHSDGDASEVGRDAGR